ncbi:hypothetical protein KPL70_011694 [Citrus sinensis]|nr:hypothetical protein KPL70_011694 [Citrus sinensis]
MATKIEDPSTSTHVVDESSDDNNDDQGSQIEPAPPVPLVPENSSKPSSSLRFTFDDIPRHKWQARHQEFTAWIDVQMTRPHAQSQNVLHEFCSRFTGSLRDWFESLGEYKQLQLIQTTIPIALAVIYEQFIGEPAASTEASRKEYHQMKCCSLKRHHLEMHYKRMSMLYYKLNGFNDPYSKHVFAASLPPELQRQLTTFNLNIANVSLGKIFQLTMLCLDKISVCLIQHLQHSSLLSENEDVESNFSEQSKQDDQTGFIIKESSDSEDISVISTVQNVNHVSTIPRPSLKMSILPSKFHKPIPVIGFIDTGADTSMIDPSVLPSDHWEPHSKLFRALSRMLRKQCPPWGPAQTEAVQQLKMIAQSPPPLRISTTRQCILQTNASDDYWSAILLEEINGIRHFCARASGQFKDSEKNYHVIYKEILAVKYGIKKFDFHLINHKFLINMDNSSFPRIFDFKNKLLPDKQLLNLKNWFAKYDFTKFLYRYFFNVQSKKPDCFPSLRMENLFLTSLTLSSLTICEDELWYMWCLTTLYATKLVFPIKPVLTHITTPKFSSDLLWTLLEWYSPLTWWRKQLKNMSTFHGLDKMPKQEAYMFTTIFIVHRPYFQHSKTRDFWTQDMAYEWKTYPRPYTLIHDTFVTSVLKSYLIELNNVQPPATNIHHTSVGPSHTLEIVLKTQTCTPSSSSSPQGILVMEQHPDYTNVLFQDA